MSEFGLGSLSFQYIIRRGEAGAGALAGLLFPLRCPQCGSTDVADQNRLTLCESCQGEFALNRLPGCPRCGIGLAKQTSGNTTCAACRRDPPPFERAFALGRYEGRLRRGAILAKRPHGETLAVGLTNWLADEELREMLIWRPELIVPVPMHWARRILRGANHADVIAATLSRRLGLPVAPVISRIKWTRPQATLAPRQRSRNVRRAFVIRKNAAIRGKRILIVDDIVTTGATCGEVARTLLAAGAEAVAVAALARAEVEIARPTPG